MYPCYKTIETPCVENDGRSRSNPTHYHFECSSTIYGAHFFPSFSEINTAKTWILNIYPNSICLHQGETYLRSEHEEEDQGKVKAEPESR